MYVLFFMNMLRTYVHMYVHTYICMYVCTYYIRTYVCTYMYVMCIHTYVHIMYVCMYVHTYVAVWQSKNHFNKKPLTAAMKHYNHVGVGVGVGVSLYVCISTQGLLHYRVDVGKSGHCLNSLLSGELHRVASLLDVIWEF